MSVAAAQLERYGRLTVLSIEIVDGRQRARCQCDCGTEKLIQLHHVRSGAIRSCGCLKLEQQTTHGRTGQPEYIAWINMKSRCGTGPGTKYHGARGIHVCGEWLDDFEAFLAHIGPRPGPGYSVDRIDPDGDYEPGNVRWATAQQQIDNRRPIVGVTISPKRAAAADPMQLNLLEALAQRDAAMARVAASADKGYRRDLDDAIELLADGGDPFCADDIRVIAGEPPAGCSPNLIGAVVNAAIKRRRVEVIGLTHSQRVVGHGNRLLLLKGRA